MMSKTIKLAYYEIQIHEGGGQMSAPQKRYKVLVVKNSTRFSPGEVLTREQVDELSGAATWEVTIVSLDPALARGGRP